MKILEGSFQCEANTFCRQRAKREDFELFEGEELLKKMAATPVFREAGAQVVPLIYASALPSGMVSREAFEYYKKIFTELIEKNRDADGIYLYLHGSMYVDGLGSGEEYLIKAIRKIVGEKLPISVALDYHANLSDGFLQNVNAVQGFRTAPHVDHDDTERRAARSLLKCIRNQSCPSLAYIRVPYLGGDAATTEKEPFVSITKYLESLDKEEEMISCAFFNGQPWYDSSYTGNCAVISGLNVQKSREAALRLAKMFWDGRENLKLNHALPVDQAVEESLKNQEGVLFVTDSGDNTTAGANGEGTLLLRKYLERNQENVLICGILDADTVNGFLDQEPGTEKEIVLCRGQAGKQEIETKLRVVLKKKGIVYGWAGDEVGEGVLAGCGNTDIVLTNARAAFTTPKHFKKMGIDPDKYRVIVIKMGYLFPRLREISDRFIFAMTPGISSNDFAQIEYQRLKKKMYPIDQTITWEDILEENQIEEEVHL
ncbi:MAG: M81 family metallopeptidase [Faecalicatena sp.]|uniref:M81 family metallopeptidase n=1 Tax=Faecalicatena sp. TaxID=2005360 RepID=UPI00258EEE8D|nr:M81 family metallopeptidase [Faecalicatena sp.]MCI6464697.1 M81 family metallopeptidase [Faecalicatena sp.]MDY5618275.1 M81 family metallopeptidase [Lachnospiraceae bacterium]